MIDHRTKFHAHWLLCLEEIRNRTKQTNKNKAVHPLILSYGGLKSVDVKKYSLDWNWNYQIQLQPKPGRKWKRVSTKSKNEHTTR